MNIKFKLEDFCGDDDVRYYLNAPFRDSQHSYATDGAIAVRVSKNDEHADIRDLHKTTGKSITRIFDGIEDRTFASLEEFKAPPIQECTVCAGTGRASKERCDECDGDGEVDAETDMNTYYGLTCKSCGGDGHIVIRNGEGNCPSCEGTGQSYNSDVVPVRFPVFGMSFDFNMLNRIDRLAGLVVSACPEKHLLYFKFSDGYGVLVSCRD